MARQFAENSWSMNNSIARKSFANKLIGSYFDIFYFGLLILSKNIFV